MTDDAANEFQAIVGTRLTLVDAIVLIDILCYSALLLPSGSTLNGPDDEPMGREEAAGLLAPLTSGYDALALKAAYDAKSTANSGIDLSTRGSDWESRIGTLGIRVTAL